MSSRIRIGDLKLDTGQRTLFRGPESIQLGPLTYKLLLALVDAAPNIATHDELVDAVWDGRDVSPGTISQRIKLLRDAISDDASDPRYIQLAHGQGYRLIPPVKILTDGSAKHRRNSILAGISLVLVAVAAYLWIATEQADPSRTGNSIAVLPFADMSPGQDQEYFADGISEEILNRLAETTALRVTARTSSFSFKGRSADIRKIRDVLDVAHVLEGSIRKSQNRVRITVQLIDTGTGARVWSATYDQELGDILLLQAEIAASVADALKVTLLGPDAPVQAAVKSVNPEAFDAYLRGRQQLGLLSRTSLERAGRYFEQSISHEPAFVQAYYSLGMTYLWQSIAAVVPEKENRSRLRELLDRGLTLAPDHAGLIALNGVVALFDRNFGLAEERLQQAMALNPSDIRIRTMYAGLKLDQGYPDEALRTAQATIEIDPLNWLPYTTLGFSNIDLGNAEDALTTAERFTQIAPVYDTNGRGMSGFIKIQMQGDFVGGIRDWESASHGQSWDHERSDMLAIAYYSIGELRKGDTWLEKARSEAPRSTLTRAVQAYRAVLDDDILRARQYALDAVFEPDHFTRWWGGVIALRLAVDALIDRGEGSRALQLLLKLAPEWATYLNQPDIAPENFSPAPFEVKSSYSSYPALYFPDFIQALEAAGDHAGAENMLGHLEAILQWRRERGLLIEEFHVAEASALRDRPEAALGALERAEENGTIYNYWQLRLLHNGVFNNIRNHPRFSKLVIRVEAEMSRQRSELSTDVPFEARSGN